ncbi:nuclease-related domain-containing protein [Bhargavaea cecembensis]|uniref:nuclease-related domain-containing protein n=2 Tax=Bhargavaea cecembensis TaxID=394098 RepID=UPI0006946FBA|nr:nuclease-related domain-containing protein [Bhargavaea cecembensis]
MTVRPYPLFLYATKRLLAMMDPSDPARDKITSEHTTTSFGYRGEVRADRYLKRSLMPAGSIILHDLHLTIPGHETVQIDTLILAKSVAYVLEVKNIYGVLELEENPARLKRTGSDGKIHYFGSPLIQLNLAIDTLSYWLFMHDISLPVKGAVILASKNLDVRFPTDVPVHLVTEIPSLLNKELTGNAAVTEQALRWTADVMKKQEERFFPYPLAPYFNVAAKSLSEDPLCNQCTGRILCDDTNRLGTCLSCGTRQWIPFIKKLVDYFLIRGSTLNIEQAQVYLGVSATKAKKLLRSPLFIKRGKSVAIYYQLNYSAVIFNEEGELIIPDSSVEIFMKR